MITIITPQKRRLPTCAAATVSADTGIDHPPHASDEYLFNDRGPSPTGATAERPRRKTRGVAIPTEAKIGVRRTALRRLRQNHSRERFVFSRVRTYSKMWLRRSSPARLPIRYLFWPACSWKKQGDMKFILRQRPKRRFFNLA